MRYLLRRNDLYLSEVYYWGSTPNLIAECYFPQVLEEAMNYPDPPQEVGELIGDDLDNVKWTKLDSPLDMGRERNILRE